MPGKRGILIAAVLALVCSACTTATIMKGQDPYSLMSMKEETQQQTPSGLAGKVIVLDLMADMTNAPVGAYLDDHYDNVNIVEQSYALSAPGFVVFEKVADAMVKAGAKLYRRYLAGQGSTPPPPGAVPIELKVESLELHAWKRPVDNVEKTYVLARTVVSCSVGGTPCPAPIEARVKTLIGNDAFDLLGEQIAESLSARIR